jgi:hypothetical protein
MANKKPVIGRISKTSYSSLNDWFLSVCSSYAKVIAAYALRRGT